MYDSENMAKEIERHRQQTLDKKKSINPIQEQKISRFKGFGGFGEFANFDKEPEVGQEDKGGGLDSVQFESVGMPVTGKGRAEQRGKCVKYDLI